MSALSAAIARRTARQLPLLSELKRWLTEVTHERASPF